VGIDTIHDKTLAKGGYYVPLSGVKTDSAARAAFKAPFSAKAVALRRLFARPAAQLTRSNGLRRALAGNFR
jgi:hypothetical protein